jgi:CheY-like chemotaxis protein
VILVIEDDEGTRETTARILRLAGHVVVTAADGREALSILESQRPAVIFCDLRMPHVDGWTFRRLQRQSSSLAGIHFVVVSASLSVDEEAEGLDADMTLYKPVDLDDMVRCAQRYDSGQAVAKRGSDGR